MTKEINWDEVTLEPMDNDREQGEESVEQEPVVTEAEPMVEFIPMEKEVQPAEEIAEIQQQIKETLKVQAQVKLETVPIQRAVLMGELDLQVPKITDVYGHYVDNDPGIQRSIVEDASGGLIKYSRDEHEALSAKFNGQNEISPEKIEALKNNLEQSEILKGQEAFDYVKVPEGAWNAEATKNLNLNDGSGFSQALRSKETHNKAVRKKIAVGTAIASFTTAVGSVGAMATAGVGTAGAATALIFGGFAAPAVLGVGALGWGAKKIYDSYKEKKAAKNFQTASVAQNMHKSLGAR